MTTASLASTDYPASQRPEYGRTLALYGLTLLTVVTLNFVLPRVMPGDPLGALVDPDSRTHILADEARARLTAYYGLDRPLPEQYVVYLGSLIRGDLGWSISQKAPVADLIAAHLPWTLLLMLPSILLATAISLLVGGHAGWVRGTIADRALLIGCVALGATPVFLVGIALLLVCSVRLGALPLAGSSTPFAVYSSPLEQAFDVLSHLALPLASLTLVMIGRDFLLVRTSMIAVLGEDFMLVARAKGLSDRALKYNHALRNALLPVVTRFSMQMADAVTGAVLIETLFAYPGMGRLMLNGVGARDYPLLEGCFLVTGVVVILANLVADLSYAWLDPRTRSRA